MDEVEVPAVFALRLEQGRTAKPAPPLPADAYGEEPPLTEAQRSAFRLMAANVAVMAPKYDRERTHSRALRLLPARSTPPHGRVRSPRARARKTAAVAQRTRSSGRLPDDPDPALAARREKERRKKAAQRARKRRLLCQTCEQLVPKLHEGLCWDCKLVEDVFERELEREARLKVEAAARLAAQPKRVVPRLRLFEVSPLGFSRSMNGHRAFATSRLMREVLV
jgi:hypothetical protein